MKELSLFTGMGGGIYGSLILGWETIAYVEKDEYCQQVIKQRQIDGWFDKGEIYGDIAEFNELHAHKYTGKVDVITGGFPCQPFSLAGSRKGSSDERYLQLEIIKTIEIVRPEWLFFENVSGLLTDPAIIDIFRSIEDAGYAIKRPLHLGSGDCGNIHKRKRVWILAHSNSRRRSVWPTKEYRNEWSVSTSDIENNRDNLWNETSGCSIREIQPSDTESKQSDGSESFPEIYHGKQESEPRNSDEQIHDSNHSCIGIQGISKGQVHRFGSIQRFEGIRSLEDIISRPDIPEPLFRRVDDELPDWRKQLKAIGNGQDPVVMATAWHLLQNQNDEY